MRRIAAAIATTALVLALAPPAHAEDNTVVVYGTDDSQAPEYTFGHLFKSCSDPWAQPGENAGFPYIDYSSDNLGFGLRVHGYQLTGSGAIGPYAFTPQPSTSEWSMRVKSMGSGTSGHAVAYYFPPDSNQTEQYWFGSAPVQYAGTDWQTADAQHTSLSWRLMSYATGSAVPVGPTGTGAVGPFTAAHGGDGSMDDFTGAYLGFILGCDASRFYFDGLRIGPPGSVTTYDFEGVRSDAMMQSQDRAITAGSGVSVVGLRGSERAFGSTEMVLQARPFGAAEFTEIGRATSEYDEETTTQQPATLTVRPKQRTEYRWVIEGSQIMEASTSAVMVVDVRTKVALTLADATLRRGQDLVAKGSTTPAKAKVPVRLQRLVGDTWRTLELGQTTRDGNYRLVAPATKKGTWTVRVVVAAASGNLAGTSPVRKATIS